MSNNWQEATDIWTSFTSKGGSKNTLHNRIDTAAKTHNARDGAEWERVCRPARVINRQTRYHYGSRVRHKNGRLGTVEEPPNYATSNYGIRWDGSDSDGIAYPDDEDFEAASAPVKLHWAHNESATVAPSWVLLRGAEEFAKIEWTPRLRKFICTWKDNGLGSARDTPGEALALVHKSLVSLGRLTQRETDECDWYDYLKFAGQWQDARCDRSDGLDNARADLDEAVMLLGKVAAAMRSVRP